MSRPLAALCLVALLAPATAFAHALESLRDVAFHPNDANTFVATYSEGGGGLLITHDHGQSFQLLCTAATTGRPEGNSAPPLAVMTGDGHLLVGTFRGLFRDDGHACNFQPVSELRDLYVWRLLNDPDDPSVVYALTSSGSGADNAAFRSRDNGASWSAIGSPEVAFFQNLSIAKPPDGIRRMSLSVCKLRMPGEDCSLRVSTDEGLSFTTLPLPEALSLTVLGFDRQNPARIYAVGDGPGVGESALALFVNDNAGSLDGWKNLAPLAELGTFSLPAEGGLWLVDPSAKCLLHVSSDGALTQAAGATCFVVNPYTGEHLLCEGWRMAQASPTGASLGGAVLDMNSVAALVACGPGFDVTALCTDQLIVGWCEVSHFPSAPFCGHVLEPLPKDAGVPVLDAGVAASPDSGCQTHRGGSAVWSLLLALALRGLRRGDRHRDQAVREAA